MSRNISLNRVEKYNLRKKLVIVSFDTRQHGIFQIKYDGDSLNEFRSEPNIMLFPSKEREYIKCVCALVHRITFEAKKPDFENPKDLSVVSV